MNDDHATAGLPSLLVGGAMTDDILRVRLLASPHGPVIRVSGRLSESTMETFLRVVAAALRVQGEREVALDLGEVGYIDVAGIAALLESRRVARELGRALVLTRVSSQVLAGIRACTASSLLDAQIKRRRCGVP